MMEILCTICARGGSKGIPGKNVKKLDEKPLIGYTIETAKKWDKFSEIVVSTDDEKISEVAREYGVLIPFKRPEKLANDDISRISAVKHACDFMENKFNKEYDFIVDLSVTSPFRKVEDIEGAFTLLINNPDTNNVYTVCESSKNPYFNMIEINDEGYAELVKSLPDTVTARQQAPEVYDMNDSINIFRRHYLLENEDNQSDKTRAYIMPKKRSIDIDHPLDFKFAEFLLQEEIN